MKAKELADIQKRLEQLEAVETKHTHQHHLSIKDRKSYSFKRKTPSKSPKIDIETAKIMLERAGSSPGSSKKLTTSSQNSEDSENSFEMHHSPLKTSDPRFANAFTFDSPLLRSKQKTNTHSLFYSLKEEYLDPSSQTHPHYRTSRKAPTYEIKVSFADDEDNKSPDSGSEGSAKEGRDDFNLTGDLELTKEHSFGMQLPARGNDFIAGAELTPSIKISDSLDWNSSQQINHTKQVSQGTGLSILPRITITDEDEKPSLSNSSQVSQGMQRVESISEVDRNVGVAITDWQDMSHCRQLDTSPYQQQPESFKGGSQKSLQQISEESTIFLGSLSIGKILIENSDASPNESNKWNTINQKLTKDSADLTDMSLNPDATTKFKIAIQAPPRNQTLNVPKLTLNIQESVPQKEANIKVEEQDYYRTSEDKSDQGCHGFTTPTLGGSVAINVDQSIQQDNFLKVPNLLTVPQLNVTGERKLGRNGIKGRKRTGIFVMKGFSKSNSPKSDDESEESPRGGLLTDRPGRSRQVTQLVFTDFSPHDESLENPDFEESTTQLEKGYYSDSHVKYRYWESTNKKE